MNADKDHNQEDVESALTGVHRVQAVLKKPWAKVLRWALWPMVVFVLVFLMLPEVLMSPPHNTSRTEAMMNVKHVGLALFSFEEYYGNYPIEATIAEVKKNKDIDLAVPLGTKSSNDFFRQLIVEGCIDKERVFYVQAPNVHKPDENKAGAKMLEAGECGFSYVVWDPFKGLPSNAPLVMTPLVPGKREFDYKAAKEYYGKSVIVLYRDNSVSVHKINSDGRVMVDGKDFFDPSQPFWGGQIPRIAWPE